MLYTSGSYGRLGLGTESDSSKPRRVRVYGDGDNGYAVAIALMARFTCHLVYHINVHAATPRLTCCFGMLRAEIATR